MAHARAAAQMLARHGCRHKPVINAVARASTMSTATTTLNMSCDSTRRPVRRGQPPTQQLWTPSAGIRFSPESEAPPLYPGLDSKRFFHSRDGATENESIKTPPPAPPSKEPFAASSREGQNYWPKLQSVKESRIFVADETGTMYMIPAQPPTQGAQPGSSKQQLHSVVEPPRPSLEFNMCKELFQAALARPKESPGSFWSHTMYKRTLPDGSTQPVKVHYCTSRHTTEQVCQKHFRDQPVLGFDLEWMMYARRDDGPRENVSLIQLASPDRIGLFHVALFPEGDDFVAPTLRAVMEDARVLKVGVRIQADCTRLRNFLGVEARGVFELSHMYNQVKYGGDRQQRKLISKRAVPLATQVQEMLKLPLFKGQSVRCGDWSMPLDSNQLTYSAADAYAGLQLYHVLEERRLAMDPTPDRPWPAELGRPIPIPPSPVVSDAEYSASLCADSSSECSDGSIEQGQTQFAAGQPAPATARRNQTTRALDPRIEAARAKVLQRRASRPGGRLFAAPSALHTFYIWEANADLSPAHVAKLVREPPLQIGTVIGYILDAIMAEKLAFSKERLRKEVLSLLHPTLASGKYRAIVKQCEEV